MLYISLDKNPHLLEEEAENMLADKQEQKQKIHENETKLVYDAQTDKFNVDEKVIKQPIPQIEPKLMEQTMIETHVDEKEMRIIDDATAKAVDDKNIKEETPEDQTERKKDSAANEIYVDERGMIKDRLVNAMLEGQKKQDNETFVKEIHMDGTKVIEEVKVDEQKLREFLEKGELTLNHVRCIIAGCTGAGKTTLLRRLENVTFEELQGIKSTEMVDVQANRFEVLEEKETIQSNNCLFDKKIKIFNIYSSHSYMHQ